MHDVTIRGGTIVDGTGAPAFAGDLAIDGGRIASVGGKAGPARREIDAAGAVVAPGWVDIHTHYDGQATWDPVLAPSSWNGATTLLFGNCGVGFAPVRRQDRQSLIDLMEGVEDIPGITLAEGLRWDWESFPQYLDVLDRFPRTVDVGSLAASAAALARPGFAIAQPVPEMQTIRSTAKSWIWMAEDYAINGGFFKDAGVRVTANASGRGTNMTALVNASVDVEWGDPGEALNAKKENLAFRTIGQTVGRFGSHVVVKKAVLDRLGVTEASPAAAKIAALKGLRMGDTGPGGAPDNLLRWLSVKGGMNPDRDLRLVPIQGGGPAIVAALSQGVIDGFCLSSPTSDLAVSKFDCAYLFNMVTNPPPELAEHTYIICSTAEKTLRDRRDPLIRYVTGLALAMKSMHEYPAKFKAFAIGFLELDPSIAETAFAGNASMYYRTPQLTEAQFKGNVAFIDIANKTAGLDPMPPSLTFASMCDPGIADEAMKRL